ncbi:MAG: serine/threonine protein phosphatase [Bacteroidales bacterium]|nr:serine/threonine protein phosphatase [Bacteroidales bacterium]
MRTLAIGDIHGCSVALDALLQVVQPAPQDQLIFLGDYVDRGPDTKGVLDRLLGLRVSHPRTIFLRGNHEIMMNHARQNRGLRADWLSVGGDRALMSYSADGSPAGFDEVPHEHWEFLTTGLRDWYETPSHIFVHANLDADLPLEEQFEDMLFWTFLSGPIRHVSGKTVIVGHSSVPGGRPRDHGCTVCIDTGVYKSGWLTCLDVNTDRYWQANQIGETRTGRLHEHGTDTDTAYPPGPS